MLRLCLSVLTIAFCGTIASAEVKKDVPKELLPFQGKWEIKEFIGDPVPPKEKLPMISFDGDKMTVMMAGSDRKETATFSAAPDKKPGEFDITPDGEKKIVKGIFKFEKETLTLCFAHEGKAAERPTEFKGDKPYTVLVLVKVKEKK